MKKIFKISIITILFSLFFLNSKALAADIYSIQDQLSRLKVGTPALHKIRFKANIDLLKDYSIQIDFTDFQIRSSAVSLDQNVIFLVEPYEGIIGRGFYDNQRVLALDISNGDQISIINNKILKITLSDKGGNSAIISKNSGLEIDIGVIDPFILNAANPRMAKTYISIYNQADNLIAKGTAANVILVNDQVGVGGRVKETEEAGIIIPEKKTALESAVNIISNVLEFISEIYQNIAAGFDSLAKTIASTPAIEKNKEEITIFVLTTAAASLVLPLAFNFELLAPFGKALAYIIFPLQRLRKKIKPWGFVYNVETRAPVPLAEVTLYEKEFGKKIATQLTDQNGRFSFLAAPGKYYIKVIKENFSFPSKLIKSEYRGEPIEIKKEKMLSLSIPLDPELSVLTKRIIILDQLSKIIQATKFPLLIIGTLVTISFYYLTKNFNDLLLVIFYILLWTFEISHLLKPKSFGVVLDEITKKPLAQCIIRFFNAQNKLIATKVTNSKGHFSALVSPGKFNLQAIKTNYKFFKKELDIKKEGLVIEDIKMVPLPV